MIMLPIDLAAVTAGNRKAIARGISLLENNQASNAMDIHAKRVPVIGITGPPGAGKSTLTDRLIGALLDQGARVAVLCIDPSSPFHRGSLLGDRIRMSNWYQHPDVYIRSLASRGSVGGLHPQIPDITELLKMAPFDYILIETVGVGQNEMAIVALADLCLLVLVPESGDDIQALKSGIMEIADIFVVNKSDRPGSIAFKTALEKSIHLHPDPLKATAPVFNVSALQNTGIPALVASMQKQLQQPLPEDPRILAERAYAMIARQRMQDINLLSLTEAIRALQLQGDVDLQKLVQQYLNPSRNQ